MMTRLLATSALATLAAAAPLTTLETRSSVPADQDGCMDHAVKELGMSAKRVGTERTWNIAPKFLHPSVAEGGTLTVRMEKGATATTVRVTATWPGGTKASDVQPEIEQRVASMARKMAQLCGVTQPAVVCQLTPAGAPTVACNPAP